MRNRRWTNASVLGLGEADPLEAVRSRAREMVITALDAGWSGPPFDPIGLAKLKNLEVVARDDVRDARLAPDGSGRLRIEYNPNKPPARVRYSIAHEVAHTLFPDCSDRVRHRHLPGDAPGDEWQLETLCNVAAAEFLMPAATLPELPHDRMNIDVISALRNEYAVSMEAVLIRAMQMSNYACAMFASSLVEHGAGRGRMRLDYIIGSRAWNSRADRTLKLPESTLLAGCRAVGFTAKGHEDWAASVGPLRVEAIGVPGHPGSTNPRVVGLIVPQNPAQGALITFLRGDATKPAADGRRCIVAHVVNDKTANWGGSGFARGLKSRFPTVQTDFAAWAHERPGRFKLGAVRTVEVADDLSVATMVAQHGYGDSSSARIRYRALEQCLVQLGDEAARLTAAVHVPRIGCGQAGGQWEVVEPMLAQHVCGKGVNVFVYDLPAGTKVAQPRQAALPW